MNNMDEAAKHEFQQEFLHSVGANRSSKDVHWPMTLALRAHLSGRASGLRHRSQASAKRRLEEKIRRGYVPDPTAAPAAPTAAPAVPTAAPAAPAPKGQQKGKRPREDWEDWREQPWWHREQWWGWWHQR